MILQGNNSSKLQTKSIRVLLFCSHLGNVRSQQTTWIRPILISKIEKYSLRAKHPRADQTTRNHPRLKDLKPVSSLKMKTENPMRNKAL